MMRRGFTIVELIITITIMGILLTLAVVNLDSTQANGRDAERKADVESFALNLENYYRNQDPTAQMSGGTYPGLAFLNDASLKAILPDLDPKVVRAPGVSEDNPMSVVYATNTSTSPATIQPQPTKNYDVYVYQPLTSTNSLCINPTSSNECRRFNIYYYREADGTVQRITSKRQ